MGDWPPVGYSINERMYQLVLAKVKSRSSYQQKDLMMNGCHGPIHSECTCTLISTRVRACVVSRISSEFNLENRDDAQSLSKLLV